MANGKKIALVTGGSKGIGLETVRNLAGASYIVLLGVRNVERGQGGHAATEARRTRRRASRSM